ncbi:MAG: hypothetical protein HY716_07250 [Planctomycetes bacterium]|nr:hypothetical protein [Planctomycetota bacterium]
MPERPDIEIYVEALRRRVAGQELRRMEIGHPFLLRSVDPSSRDVEGKRVLGIRRMGKRIILKADWPRSVEELEARYGGRDR